MKEKLLDLGSDVKTAVSALSSAHNSAQKIVPKPATIISDQEEAKKTS